MTKDHHKHMEKKRQAHIFHFPSDSTQLQHVDFSLSTYASLPLAL